MQSSTTGTGFQGNVIELISGESTAGRFALVDLTVARSAEPPCHRHHNEDELVYVLAGEVQILIGAKRLTANMGTAVFLPRGIEHGFAVVSSQARLLTGFFPAGFERFYRDTADTASEELDHLIATAARYGCEVIGPPISGVRD